MHAQQQYLWYVLYYQFQLNQALLPPLITYIGQSLYPHISWFFPGVNFLNCPSTCPRRQHQYINQGWLQRQASIYNKGQHSVVATTF